MWKRSSKPSGVTLEPSVPSTETSKTRADRVLRKATFVERHFDEHDHDVDTEIGVGDTDGIVDERSHGWPLEFSAADEKTPTSQPIPNGS